MDSIEHLPSHVLEKVPQTLLGDYQPRLCIMTTPNAEFNIYFPNLKYGTKESLFRHDDHQFEWTRKEFQDW